ncbi:MAG: RNA-binding S4 domain-containing protein [Bacteroidota bacterium]|nr:RNA-binding S4 domain-containing protein [Bacteroidota bacterium]
MIKFELRENDEYIELIKLLKVVNIASSGAEAKLFVDNGEVKLNGEEESRKRAKIRSGNIVEIFDQKIMVE